MHFDSGKHLVAFVILQVTKLNFTNILQQRSNKYPHKI